MISQSRLHPLTSSLIFHTFTRDTETCPIVLVNLKDKFDGERYNEYVESKDYIDPEVYEKSKPKMNKKP